MYEAFCLWKLQLIYCLGTWTVIAFTFFISYLMELGWEEMIFQIYELLTEIIKCQYVIPSLWFSTIKLEAKWILVLDGNPWCSSQSHSLPASHIYNSFLSYKLLFSSFSIIIFWFQEELLMRCISFFYVMCSQKCFWSNFI